MALHALKIVQEEIARAVAVTMPDKHVLLVTVGEVIEERIKKECIEQPDPSDDTPERKPNPFSHEELSHDPLVDDPA